MDLINWENLPLQTTPLNKTMLKQFQDNINNGKVDKTLTTLNAVDLNTVKETGFYYCSSCSNIPSGASNGYLDVLRLSDSYVLQKYYKYDGVGSFERKCVRGTWENWIETPYEINGTWIPELSTLEGAEPTIDYTSRRGGYKKLGNMVFISFFIQGSITGLSGTDNYAIVRGLPFENKALSLGENTLSTGVAYNCVATTGEIQLLVYQNIIRIQSARGATAVRWQLTPSGAFFRLAGSGWYETA